MTDERTMRCADVEELAGIYVLGALEPDEEAAVTAHLETCPEAHATFAELAGASAALAVAVEPADAPDGLRDRVLEAVAATPQVTEAVSRPQAGDVSATETAVPQPRDAASSSRSWLDRFRGAGRTDGRPGAWGVLGAAAAVLAVVLMGAWIVTSIQQQGDANQRLALLRSAVAAAADPAGNVAVLEDTDAGVAGYAVFPADDPGYIVIDGLPDIPTGQAYQAWFLSGGVPTSAGLLSVGDDGLAVVTQLEPVPGTDIVALTVEDLPGAEAPTSDPILVGELRAATASAPVQRL